MCQIIAEKWTNGKESKPIALLDKSGNMITNSEGIKKLCLEEILERVRHRQIHPDLKDLQALKELLCQKRLDLVKHVKSKPWNLQDLDKVLQQLKKKKCRDPQGYINELFKSKAAGHDLKISILHIMNRAKYLLEVPDMMKDVNVVMIPKSGKQNLHNIQNQRGIFLISVFTIVKLNQSTVAFFSAKFLF